MSKKLAPFGKAGIDDCVSFLVVLRMKIEKNKGNKGLNDTQDIKLIICYNSYPCNTTIMMFFIRSPLYYRVVLMPYVCILQSPCFFLFLVSKKLINMTAYSNLFLYLHGVKYMHQYFKYKYMYMAARGQYKYKYCSWGLYIYQLQASFDCKFEIVSLHSKELHCRKSY